LHFSPHPDDELIGAPATLMALRDAGWRIVNVACGLGRPGQHLRRARELLDACRRVRFELRFPERPIAISPDDDHAAAYAALVGLAEREIGLLEPEIVVSPSPHDRHHGHEVVARAVRDALRTGEPAGPRWWMWGLWASLPQPTLGTVFDRGRLEEILAALAAHRGELARNDYRRLVEGRAAMNASLGPELLFGFGVETPQVSYLELLTEVVPCGDRWLLGAPRWLDARSPLADPREVPMDAWLYAPGEPPAGRRG